MNSACAIRCCAEGWRTWVPARADGGGATPKLKLTRNENSIGDNDVVTFLLL
jgi:hypothetical protein